MSFTACASYCTEYESRVLKIGDFLNHMVLKPKLSISSGAQWDGGQSWDDRKQGNPVSGFIKRCMLASASARAQADKQNHYE